MRGPVGVALKLWRLERNYTLRTAAEVFVSEMENGSRRMPIEIRTQLRSAIPDIDDLFLADNLLRVVRGEQVNAQRGGS